MAELHFSGKEVTFPSTELIVSKTDLKGNLTYVNQTFCTVSGYEEKFLLGKPHSIIRHDNMPRCIFKLIWERIHNGQEIFGYVVNRTITQDYYWVLAHVTPSLNSLGQITGYHSNRRVPEGDVIARHISPLYAELLQIENQSSNRRDGLNKSYDYLVGMIKGKGVDYAEFILTL